MDIGLHVSHDAMSEGIKFN
ncbi:uncharacterized protein G2W53_037619 [Senna tora]|uniref:Uncharacterized protein n=1 Tax=Senna tora TaxID=362788 RepID=A0A834W199_9FABA|nr:uncharacterized protein G2W53_037619 [Senna tora]